MNGASGVIKIGDLGLATLWHGLTTPQSVLGTCAAAKRGQRCVVRVCVNVCVCACVCAREYVRVCACVFFLADVADATLWHGLTTPQSVLGTCAAAKRGHRCVVCVCVSVCVCVCVC